MSNDPYTSKNAEQVDPKQKIDDLIAFVDGQKFCMMTTRVPDQDLLVSRCMALAAKENNGVDLIFHSNHESGKISDLQKHSKVNLAFQNASGEWASVSGDAQVDSDSSSVKQYYHPALKAWVGDLGDGKHDGGPEDPRLCIIRIKPETAQYALAAKNIASRAFDVAKGAITGETPAIHSIRHVQTAEFNAYRTRSG